VKDGRSVEEFLIGAGRRKAAAAAKKKIYSEKESCEGSSEAASAERGRDEGGTRRDLNPVSND
jgi:hypothetical protein